jgi:hypothetical protein
MPPLSFKDLSELGLYKFGRYRDSTVVIHDDDRWILPVVLAAQNDGLINPSATLISFDQHHDALDVRAGISPLVKLRKEGCPSTDFLKVVKEHLSSLDDDWIKAGMELDLFSDAVVFGVARGGDRIPRQYKDHMACLHKVLLEYSLPGHSLGYHGNLSDIARHEELRDLWDVLRWQPAKGQFAFHHDAPQLVVNIDLDCFAVYWRDFAFPWPDEVFEDHFEKPSDYFGTTGFTGGWFIRELLARAPIITIAREPSCCGSDAKADEILEKVDRFVFGGELKLS